MSREFKVSMLQIEDHTCPAIGYQQATVCVPVSVQPFAMAGTPTTFCCGDPIITPGTITCPGTPNGSCIFTITQEICVEVPIMFGANTVVGAPSVECGEATSENICANCSPLSATLSTKKECKNCKK